MEKSGIGNTLLPVGKEIDFNGKRLSIIDEIGSGFTSIVYKGQLIEGADILPVAIKAMKPLDLAIAEGNFREEAETLALLRDYEQEANEKQGVDFKVAPIYYGLGKHDETQYIVMEFIRGVELSELLNQKGHLPENDALTIGWHFFRTLDILHTQVNKTLVDLKLENLWWVANENDDGGHLKITDLGSLTSIRAGCSGFGSAERDLLLASIILFRLLTGYPLEYSIYGLREQVNPLLKAYPMSWGTAQLLKRLLHNNMKMRFPSARAVMNDLRTLTVFWDSPSDKLFEISNANLNEALMIGESDLDQAHSYAKRAQSALDIIRIRDTNFDPKVLGHTIDQAKEILSVSDFFQTGMLLFDGESYQEAKDRFKEGINWSEEPALLRRWVYLTSIPEQIPHEIFAKYSEEAKQALEKFNEGNWIAAIERLEALKPHLDSSGLEALLADAQLFLQSELAFKAKRDDEHLVAAQAYRAALDALQSLPDSEFVQDEEVGNILSFAEEMENLVRTRDKAGEDIKKAYEYLKNDDANKATKLITEVIHLDPEHPKLALFFERSIDLAIERMNFSVAEEITDLGRRSPSTARQVLPAAMMVHSLANAQHALLKDDYSRFVEYLRAVLANKERISLASSAVSALLAQAEQKASDSHNVLGLMRIAEVLEALPSDESVWANRLRKKAEEYHQVQTMEENRAVDRVIASTLNLLYIEQPKRAINIASEYDLTKAIWLIKERDEQLQKALIIAKDAVRLATYTGYCLEDAKQLEVRILKKIQDNVIDFDEASKMQLKSQEQKLSTLTTQWENAQRLKYESHAKIEEDTVLDHPPILNKQLRRELLNVVTNAQEYLCYLDPNNAKVREIFRQSIQQLNIFGKEGWHELARIAEDNIANITSDFNNVHELLERGDIQTASIEIDRLSESYVDSPEWTEVKAGLIRISAFLEWQENNQARLEIGDYDTELVKHIRDFLGANIPWTYWASKNTLDYLPKAREHFMQRVKKQINSFKDAEFSDLIKQWISLQKTIERARRASRAPTATDSKQHEK